MARRYRRGRKRRFGRRRRRTFRRTFKRRRRNFGTKHYHYKRTVLYDVSTTATASTFTGNALGIGLSELPNYTEFTALYDQFRINKIKWEFVPVVKNNIETVYWNTTTLIPVTSYVNPPETWTYLDYDDGSTPTESEALQSQTLRKTPGGRKAKRIFRPAVLFMAYETVSTTAYSPQWKKWIDCGDNTTPHYGLKYGWYNSDPSNNQDVKGSMYVTYYFSCRGVR